MRHLKQLGFLFLICSAIVAGSLLWRSTNRQAISADSLGVYDIPRGKYLFVEYWLETSHVGLFDFPYYSYRSETLNGRLEPLPDWENVKGFIGYGASSKGGSGAYRFLKVIGGFPISASVAQEIPKIDEAKFVSPSVLIEAVQQSGTIIINIDQQIYALNANESWTVQAKDDNGYVISHRFTNYGLLERNQINLY